MNILIKKHSLFLKENSAKSRSLFDLLNKKISNKSLKINEKAKRNLMIKTFHFNFSTNDNFDKNDNVKIDTINLSNNPCMSVEDVKREFNLNLNEEQKINFDAFYAKMKENIDALVEMNKQLKENSNNM